MKFSKQEIIVYHKAKDLYRIVMDIEKYPEFIPWCESIKIIDKSRNKIKADMVVYYKFFPRKSFTSNVIYNSSSLSIQTSYIKGPLKDLKTEWIFKKINSSKTKVFFNVTFEFEKVLHQKLAEIFYNLIEKKMIDSFIKRANKILN